MCATSWVAKGERCFFSLQGVGVEGGSTTLRSPTAAGIQLAKKTQEMFIDLNIPDQSKICGEQ